MSDENANTNEAPTRRKYMKYGGAVIGGGLLAGCTGDGGAGGDGGSTDAGTPTDTPTETPTDTPTDIPTETLTGTPTTTDTSYSVTMSPMGTVEFDEVPERVVAYDAQWTDHLVALGQQDRIVAMGFPDRYHTGFYDQLPDVSFDPSDLTAMYNDGSYDKELLYDLDGDIHHMNPFRVAETNDNFDASDVDEIIENVGPWFANRGSRSNIVPGGRDVDYEFYTLWELLSKFAQVYQVQDRSAALKSVRDGMVEHIQSNLPPEDERLSVALAIWWKEDIWVYDPNAGGFGKVHYRPVQLNDALPDVQGYAESNWTGGKIGAEKLLDADSDVWIQHNSVTSIDWFENSGWRGNSTASSVPTVRGQRRWGFSTSVFRRRSNQQASELRYSSTEFGHSKYYTIIRYLK